MTRDVDLVRLYDGDRTWQGPADCWWRLSARRRGKPRFFVFVDERNTHAENSSRCTCFLGKVIHLRSRYGINRGQEGPLIQIWRTRLVDEYAVARTSREPLKRQSHQIPESTRRH